MAPSDDRDRDATSSARWARRDVLRMAAVAGLLPLAACRTARLIGSVAPEAHASPLGPEYVELGLGQMAAAHRQGWLAGHGGAAILAAYFFCLDHRLDERTALAVKANVDGFTTQSPEPAPRVEPGPGTADPARIVEALDLHVHELRSGGHDATYAALALRALAARPDLATPAIVDGIVRLIAAHVGAYRPVAETPFQREQPLPPYAGSRDLAAATFRAALRPWDDVRRIGASGVLHWITHAEAIVTLEELGHPEVARHAWAAHRLSVHQPVLHAGAGSPRRDVDWLAHGYWESDAPRRVFNGSWLAGHSFKLPYSLLRLLRHVEDEDLRAAATLRAAELLVPFDPRRGA